MSEQLTEASEQPNPTGDRRIVDVFLTILTTLLFIGFLWMIISHPQLLSAEVTIALGFGLIVYSVGATWAYERWINRRLARNGAA